MVMHQGWKSKFSCRASESVFISDEHGIYQLSHVFLYLELCHLGETLSYNGLYLILYTLSSY